MKRLVVVATVLSVLLPLVSQPAKAIGCKDSTSYIILPSGQCLDLSEGVGVKQQPTVNRSPLVVSGLKLKRGVTRDVMNITGSLTNTSNKVYRLPSIMVRIGESRIEEVILDGLISPGQTRKFESQVDRSKYSLQTPLSVEKVEAFDL